jgi:hypothetical protein
MTENTRFFITFTFYHRAFVNQEHYYMTHLLNFANRFVMQQLQNHPYIIAHRTLHKTNHNPTAPHTHKVTSPLPVDAHTMQDNDSLGIFYYD